MVEFINTVLSILDIHAPIKRKYIHANNSAFMTQELRAVIMQRSKLRQKFLKQRTNNSKHLCNRQRNLCVSLLQKTQKVINNKVVSDNRKFWQKISPFSEKALPKETIILKADSRTIMINHELAETFNIFYSNITQHIKIDRNLLEITQDLNTSDPVLKAIRKYEKHLSIIKIKENMRARTSPFLLVLLLRKQF